MSGPSRVDVATVYLAGFLQGCSFVLIPALGNTLMSSRYGLRSSEYALLYLPQTAGAIVAALAAGWVQRQLGVARLFRLGLLANLLAMLLLVAVGRGYGSSALFLLLLETLLLGIGFGWTQAAINQYSAMFFGRTAGTAITLLNALIGGATAVSPLLLSAMQPLWELWPLMLAGGFCAACVPRLPAARLETTGPFWPSGLAPIVLLTLLYAVCEGVLGSWASVYATSDRRLSVATGALALSCFWGAMTAARVLLALVPASWVSRRTCQCASALGMALCFAILPSASSAVGLIGVFTMAGAACSIYYPFTMALGLERFADRQAHVAGLVIAALMIGEGLGSYGPGVLRPALGLPHVYQLSAVLGIPLLIGAWRLYAARPSATPKSAT